MVCMCIDVELETSAWKTRELTTSAGDTEEFDKLCHQGHHESPRVTCHLRSGHHQPPHKHQHACIEYITDVSQSAKVINIYNLQFTSNNLNTTI